LSRHADPRAPALLTLLTTIGSKIGTTTRGIGPADASNASH
jgi:adenylosuccinate synthase